MIDRTWKQFLSWLLHESLKIFTAPMSVYGGAVDALKGWKYSRNSTMFWIHLPAFLLLTIVYLVFGFSVFERTDSKIQRYVAEGERLISTKSLERIATSKFPLFDPNGRQTLETAFPTDRAKRAFQFAGLLAKRVLSFEPNSVPARYRIALMQSIEGKDEEAKETMFDLVSGDYGVFQPASAWVASWIIQAKEDKREVDMTDLGKHLKNATSWSDCNIQLLFYYSQILEQNGLTPAAIDVATEAAKRERAYNVHLAKLYSKMKNEEGLRQAAYAAEEYFGARLNTGNERDVDRLAVSEVRALMGRYPQAASVLEEGLMNNAKRPELSKALSNIRIAMFQQSLVPGPDGVINADMAKLESAIDADPKNPAISEQAASLLTKKIKPTKKIIDALRKQIETNVTTAESHSMIAQGYYLMGNEREAIKNWELAITKNPQDVTSHNNLAFCLSRSASPDIDRELQLIEAANAIAPNNAEVLDTFGQVLMIAKKPKEAINKYEQCIAVDGNRIETRKKLVEAYVAAGLEDLAKAQREVIESMEGKPEPSEKPKTPNN